MYKEGKLDLDKLDTEHKGQIVSQGYQFDLIYWVSETPGVSLRLLKKIILEIAVDKQKVKTIVITEDNVESE